MRRTDSQLCGIQTLPWSDTRSRDRLTNRRKQSKLIGREEGQGRSGGKNFRNRLVQKERTPSGPKSLSPTDAQCYKHAGEYICHISFEAMIPNFSALFVCLFLSILPFSPKGPSHVSLVICEKLSLFNCPLSSLTLKPLLLTNCLKLLPVKGII